MAGVCAAKISIAGLGAELSWWIVAPLAVLFGAGGTWAGAREGRVDGIRREALEPDEILLTAYEVCPLTWEGRVTRDYDFARFELRVTNRGLQMWKQAEQLWSHPWPTLRLTAEGELVLVHRAEDVIAELLVKTQDGSPDELLLAAERLRARSRHS
ncbi:hypothetical protein KPP03845_100046 [Streptomyces xanthophaeus]|uniref:hypothetical protein n=1 Tax=Streptomyces xanthophaeus TaxID=67385 RepID=UPI00233E81F1|nr:hypothetical protein [Streptomyces xanthophaeus]WCD83727.1 hypothetical protein KPP03845_100046 [Streptomyces xanthophaeus]